MLGGLRADAGQEAGHEGQLQAEGEVVEGVEVVEVLRVVEVEEVDVARSQDRHGEVSRARGDCGGVAGPCGMDGNSGGLL